MSMHSNNKPAPNTPPEALPGGDGQDWSQDLALASTLFDGLAEDGADTPGITRDSYGGGEERAHTRIAALARAWGLEVRTDAALNLYVTFPGRDRSLPAAFTGSHLDSVPCGGNFDGAAGVVAGMTVFGRWLRNGYVPPHDCTVMAVRAEESAWFPLSYIGSKAAFGMLSGDDLDVRRSDDGRTLTERMHALGGDPDSVRRGEAHLAPHAIGRFVELHIEQGPMLVEQGLPVGIVTGIRGAFRFRHAQAIGEYAHSGAAVRAMRRDAMFAVAHLITVLDRDWDDAQAEGRDLVITFGRVETDPKRADFSKVPGHVSFSVDVRSIEPDTLQRMEARVRERCAEITARLGVEFDLGLQTHSKPAAMDAALRASLLEGATKYGIPAMEMASGAGHDAAIFAGQGIPTAMIFVRNENGSHNPDEAMTMDDFACALQLLEYAMVCTF
jgi:beta-ureidopropionase / N-carbamoyl-L-amino-acid hydrolase